MSDEHPPVLFIFHRSSFIVSTRPPQRDAGSWRSSRALPSCPAARKPCASFRGRGPSESRAFRAGIRCRCEPASRVATSWSVPPSSRSRLASLALFTVTAAQGLVFVLVSKLLERLERGLDHVVRIGGAEGLGQNVLNSSRLENCAHRPTGDHARTIRGRFEKDSSRSVMTDRRVRNRRAAHGDGDHVLLGDLDPLLDRCRNFLGLPRSKADVSLTVADDHQGAESEVLSALDDLRHAVDVDDLVDHSALGPLALATVAAGRSLSLTLNWPLHVSSLEFQTVFARGIRERFDVAVILITTAVEDHVGHALVLRLLRDQRADRFGRRLIGTALDAGILVATRCGGDGLASRIIDELHVNVLEALLHREARALRGPCDRAPD